MTQETANKAKALTDEIYSLERYEELLADRKYSKVAHMEFLQHYGTNSPSISFDPKYNELFVPIIRDIISKLKEELSKL